MRPRGNPALSAADRFASDARVAALLEQLVAKPSLQKQALARPESFLKRQGIDLPPGLTVQFGPQLKSKLARPTPDWFPFSIRLTRCRTVWIRDPVTQRLRQETVCFGIEITPSPVPGGPIG